MTILHAPLCYYFVEVKEYGVVGLSYSSIISYSTQLIFLLIFTYTRKELEKAVKMPNAAAFRDWGSYMNLAIPSVLTACSDWWAVEIIVFISGYLGVVQQASFVILVSMGAQLA